MRAKRMHVSASGIALLFVLLLGGCGNQTESAMSLGRAYVGGMKVPLYKELEAGAAVNAELDFGTPVTLLRQRRSFYYVRAASGQEGWTSRSALFNEAQVREVRALSVFAAEAEAQGEARVFATLNVHNYPNRVSPSIFQIHEGETVAMIRHERHAREPYEPGPLVGGAPTAVVANENGEEAKEDEVTPPPLPPPPGLPSTWARLSGLSAERVAALRAEGVLANPGARSARASGDLWTLVRKKEGLAGWALHARLVPAIPDRVAQYSEGARITSYFSLGEANKDGSRSHWLWTTLQSSDVAFDFDSFRVFVWNNRLQRFETAFIQRGVEGYLPTEVFRTDEGEQRFRVNVREKSGVIHRRTYALRGMQIRLVQSVPWPNFDPLRQAPLMERLHEVRVTDSALPGFGESPAEKVSKEPVRWWKRVFGG